MKTFGIHPALNCIFFISLFVNLLRRNLYQKYADCCQCEDRAHRIGQKDSVTCYYFLGRRTIDEKVYRIIQEKKNIANAVTGSTEDIEENIVDMVARIFDTDYDEED